jgi:Mg2+-importing ATPase
MLTNANDTYWSLSREELLSALDTGQKGLERTESTRRRARFGRNTLSLQVTSSPLTLLFRQFTNPLILILLFAAVISVMVGEWTDAGVISLIVVGSALVTFFQENAATKAVDKLRKRLVHKVTALRDGAPVRVNAESIVPGDVIVLSAGSLIPADGVLIESDDLFVNQAVLTGETFPVEKRLGATGETASLPERTNCVFMGTSVRSGIGRFVVVRTGLGTEYGKIAEQLGKRVPETEFERGIRQFGLLLSRIMIGLVLFVFAANVLFARPPIDSLLFAIALAVGISPELLPAIITITLSKGARKMARSGVIVRRLDSIENLGSMDVLCTDKTGTLTEGIVRLDGALNADGHESALVRRLAYMNAFYQSGLSNPLDEAITSSDRTLDIEGVEKLSEIPYDFERKRLGVVIREKDGRTLLIVKGALDGILNASSTIRGKEGVEILGEASRTAIGERLQHWGEQGFRVLGVASKPVSEGAQVSRSDEEALTFEGYLLFLDPPKQGAAMAIEELAELNVDLKIITGDNRYVTGHLAEAVGLRAEETVTGAELNKLTDPALWHIVEKTTLFVEVDPNQKQRIIRALQRCGHVVGYLGDGINDAPALQEADVGISVDGAVDVAREAADLVLLQKGLGVLRQGIVEGRMTFANSLKYVFTTTSANFGNMFSMAGATLFLPFLPLLAKQILLNNFLSDIPAIAIASDNVDEEYIRKPPRWNIKFIRNFMILFGTVSSVFDFVTFGALLYFVRASEKEFQTSWFIESLMTELLVALVVRTRRPLFKSVPGKWLLISTSAVVGLTLMITYLPFSSVFGFVPLPAGVLGLIVLISLVYIIATEIVKHFFYRQLES